MGLAEKRAAKEFENTHYAALKSAIDEAAGFEVSMDVRWETLAREEKYVAMWADAWPKLYFRPIIEAFERICVDDMGKEALRAALKKIIVQNTQASYSSYWATFENGVLTLDYPFTNVESVNDRRDELQKVVEKAL